jgi:uncharacterized protein YggE
VTRQLQSGSGVVAAFLVGALVVAGGFVAADMSGSPADRGTNAGIPNEGAAAHAPTGDDRRIAVGADGEAETEPDAAEIRLSVEATAADPGTARDRVARNVSRMRDALRKAGVPDDAVQTTDFDVHQDRRRRPPREGEGGEETVRYRASHGFRIDTSVDRAGAVTDAALDGGATTVRDVRFTLTTGTRREVRRAALEDAMSNARDQARTLADRANLTITGVRTVSTGGVSVDEPRYERALATATGTGSDGAATTLESGPVTVRVNVEVTYGAGE